MTKILLPILAGILFILCSTILYQVFKLNALFLFIIPGFFAFIFYVCVWSRISYFVKKDFIFKKRIKEAGQNMSDFEFLQSFVIFFLALCNIPARYNFPDVLYLLILALYLAGLPFFVGFLFPQKKHKYLRWCILLCILIAFAIVAIVKNFLG